MENINSNTESRDYRIERLDKSRLKHLEYLHKKVYGTRREKGYFLKKYSTAFTGTEYIGYIAYNSLNIPIAYYGVFPCFIQFNGKIILSAQSGDTMTHPEYRYKGLFVELAKNTFNLCKEKGILLIFGFPNQSSYHGLVHKLGWRVTENMLRFTIHVNTFPFASLLKYFGWSKWIYEKYAIWILHKYLLPQIGIPNSSCQREFACVYRDENYLRYKTYNQTYVIKVGNAKLWIKIKNGLTIGDLDLGNQDFDLVMEELKKVSRRLGISKISFQVSPGTYLHSLLVREFQPIPSFPVVFKDLGTGMPLDKVKFTFADIDIF